MSAARDHGGREVQAAWRAVHRSTDRGGQSTDLRRQYQAWAEDQGAPRGGQGTGAGQSGDLVRAEDADRAGHSGWVFAEELSAVREPRRDRQPLAAIVAEIEI